MGRGDNKRSPKTLKKRAQKRKKDRLKAKIVAGKAAKK